MSRPGSHIFGLTHAEKVTAISAACHLLKKAITVKYYCHNSKVYQAMSKGLLAPSQPFSFLWCNWTQQSVCKRKEYFHLIIICVLVCLEMKFIKARQILHPLAYLFIEQTHGILPHFFTLHQFLPFFVIRVIDPEPYPFSWAKT